jgi:hypothetical protein
LLAACGNLCGKPAVSASVHCKAHGGGVRCSELDCPKSAQGTTGKCIAHGDGRWQFRVPIMRRRLLASRLRSLSELSLSSLRTLFELSLLRFLCAHVLLSFRGLANSS